MKNGQWKAGSIQKKSCQRGCDCAGKISGKVLHADPSAHHPRSGQSLRMAQLLQILIPETLR